MALVEIKRLEKGDQIFGIDQGGVIIHNRQILIWVIIITAQTGIDRACAVTNRTYECTKLNPHKVYWLNRLFCNARCNALRRI